jgi:hypothetical protein
MTDKLDFSLAMDQIVTGASWALVDDDRLKITKVLATRFRRRQIKDDLDRQAREMFPEEFDAEGNLRKV